MVEEGIVDQGLIEASLRAMSHYDDARIERQTLMPELCESECEQ